jgi:hypothetical protein
VVGVAFEPQAASSIEKAATMLKIKYSFLLIGYLSLKLMDM